MNEKEIYWKLEMDKCKDILYYFNNYVKIKPMETIDKRSEQKKETWIKNVIKIQGLSREETVALYNKIYKEDK